MYVRTFHGVSEGLPEFLGVLADFHVSFRGFRGVFSNVSRRFRVCQELSEGFSEVLEALPTFSFRGVSEAFRRSSRRLKASRLLRDITLVNNDLYSRESSEILKQTSNS